VAQLAMLVAVQAQLGPLLVIVSVPLVPLAALHRCRRHAQFKRLPVERTKDVVESRRGAATPKPRTLSL
jgi:hypothetical protein